MRIGPAGNPDATVDQLQVTFDLMPGQGGGLKVKSVRLVRPWVRLRLVPGQPVFGALQPLIDQFTRQPAGAPAAPPPDITIEGARILLVTSGGQLQLGGDAKITRGVLRSAQGSLTPFAVTLDGQHVEGDGGTFQLTSDGKLATGTANFHAVAYGPRQRSLRADSVTLHVQAPYPAKSGDWSGPMDLALAASGLTGFLGALQAGGGNLTADATGTFEANRTRQAFAGRLSARSDFETLSSGNTKIQTPSMDLVLAHLGATHTADGISITAAGATTLEAKAAQRAGVSLSALASAIRIGNAEVGVAGGAVTTKASLTGDLTAAGSASPGAAARTAAAVPLLSSEPPYRSAIARALRSFRVKAAWRAGLSNGAAMVGLTAPATLASSSGARLVVTDPGGGVRFAGGSVRGGANVVASGGGLPELRAQFRNAAFSPGRFQADLSTEDSLDIAFARGAHVQAKGHLSVASGQVRFDLAGCAPVTAKELALGANPITSVAASVCPGGQPIVVAGHGGWRAMAALRAARGDAPSLGTNIRAADGGFAVRGAGGGVGTVALTLSHGWVVDGKQPGRFNPVQASGQAGLARDVWTGAFDVRSGGGHPVGRLTLRHDQHTGAGRIDIDASGLAFTPDGLQPIELSPIAAMLRQMDGPAPFNGWIAWTPNQPATSGGELTLKDDKFKSPLGPLAGLNGKIVFTSLAPLTTAPSQPLTVAKIEAITPMTDLAGSFSLQPDALVIEGAQAAFAGGTVRLEHTSIPLGEKPTFDAVVDLDHVDVGQVIAASSLSKGVQLQASINGRVPFQIAGDALHITGGHIEAAGPGRLTISRDALSGVSGTAGVSATTTLASGQAGFAQDLAYQALEDLAFDQLSADLNSQANERLGVLFHIKGRHDPPKRVEAHIAISDVIGGHPLAKPIPLPSDTVIDLTLDTSLNFGELVRGLEEAIRQSQAGARSAPVHGPPAELAAP